jgi:hypothetical protein
MPRKTASEPREGRVMRKGISIRLLAGFGCAALVGVSMEMARERDAARLAEAGRDRERSPEATCRANLRQLSWVVAAADFAQPGSPPRTLEELARTLGRDDRRTRAALHCPCDASGEECSYELLPVRGEAFDPDRVVLQEKRPFHGGRRHVIRADGRLDWIDGPRGAP